MKCRKIEFLVMCCETYKKFLFLKISTMVVYKVYQSNTCLVWAINASETLWQLHTHSKIRLWEELELRVDEYIKNALRTNVKYFAFLCCIPGSKNILKQGRAPYSFHIWLVLKWTRHISVRLDKCWLTTLIGWRNLWCRHRRTFGWRCNLSRVQAA